MDNLKTSMLKTIILLFPLLSLAFGDGNDKMSFHYVLPRHLAGVTNVVIAADAATTEGPFFEVVSDYVNTTNLKADAYAGSPGVTVDRKTVVDGISFNLTLGFFKVSTALEVVGPLEGAEIFIWHADAIGTYSSVDSQMQTEITTGQYWLRATQVTDADGLVKFQTILPGWYQGRAVHWHIRVKLPGASAYVATTQLFLHDSFVTGYEGTSPYSADTNSVTNLESDYVYSALNPAVAAELVLNPVGSKAAGFAASLNFGIASLVVSPTNPTSKPIASKPTPVKPTLKPAVPTLKPVSRTSVPNAPTRKPITPTFKPVTPPTKRTRRPRSTS